MLDAATNNLILVEGAATYERILEAVREDDIEEGIFYIKDFLKIYPEFAQAHNDLAVLYYRAGDTLKSLAHHEKALKLAPNNNIYRKNLADFYYVELEWVGEAVHLYSDIIKDNPDDIEALNALGTIHLQLGRKEKARKFFARTLELDAANLDAQAAMQQLPTPGNTARALPPASDKPAPPAPQPPPVFREVTPVITPQPIMAPPVTPARPASELYREANDLIAKDNLLDAISLLKESIQQDPKLAVAHNDLGVLYQRIGDRQQSRRHHEEAARLQPNSAIFQKNLADLLCSEFEDFEEALRIYVALLAKNNTDIELLKAITHVCLMVGNRPDAEYFLQQILTLKPWDQEASEALRELKANPAGTASR